MQPKILFLIAGMAMAILFTPSCKKGDSPTTTTPPPAAPVISQINPDTAGYGVALLIVGNNFSANTAADAVTINGMTATVLKAGTDSLTVIVPLGAGTGPVSVTVSNVRATGPSLNYIKTPVVSTLAGNGTGAFSDGPASSAAFHSPTGIIIDSLGTIFVCDQKNYRIRKISASGSVTTIAGDGNSGFRDSTGAAAEFGIFFDIAEDMNGNLFVPDYGNHCIRKITSAGKVSTFAGSSTPGFFDGTGASAAFRYPSGIAIDPQGNLYVTDQGNNNIRKITPSGVVSTFAGDGNSGYIDGAAASARFTSPNGIAIDGQGNLYIGDTDNNRVRKISASGVVSTVAGNGIAGMLDGVAGAAEFKQPFGVAVDARGNVYVVDYGNQRIRMITPTGNVSTLAGNGSAAFADGPGTQASFNYPWGVAVDASGANILIGDFGNNRVRKIIWE